MKLVLLATAAALLATPALAKDPISAFIEAVILSSKTHDGLQRKTPDRRPTANEIVRGPDGKVVGADPDQRIRTRLAADPPNVDGTE